MKANSLHSWILALILLGAGFAQLGCRHLAPEGVYHGDSVLYHAELSTRTSYDLLHVFVQWELDNRAALAKWPEITKAADHIRLNAKQWFATANNLHDAYAADPSQDNRDKLQTALAVLQTALLEANGYMLQAATRK